MNLVFIKSRFKLTFGLLLYDAQMILHQTVKVVWVVALVQEVLLQLAVVGLVGA